MLEKAPLRVIWLPPCSNIYSKSSNIFTCMYTQAVFKLRAPLSRGLSIYIYMGLSSDCNKILIGCFLIRILEGTSIMYASPMHMFILLYVIMTQLLSVMTAIHEYGTYETSLIIKNKIFKFAIKSFITIM